MTRVAALACAALSLAASAFHVQVGVSGLYTDGGTFDGGTFTPNLVWTNATGEVGATNGYFEGFGLAPAIVSHVQGWTFKIGTRNGYYGTKTFTCAETVQLGTFGYYYSSIPGQDWRVFNSVFTCRGDPYSTVVNDTGADRTINGVRISAGQGKRLPFPLELYMDEIDGVKFYDLATDDELTPSADAYTGEIYVDGHYYLGWTGDFRIAGPASNRVISAERLLYGEDASNSIVYAENSYPIYEGRVLVNTNVQLNTWWDFAQNEWGGSPQARINGDVVCSSHSTSHIIAYTVNASSVYVSEMSGEGTFYFTMSQTPASGYGGGSCVFKCWDANAGSSTAGYAAAAPEHKAAISGGTSTLAEFKVTINIYTGKWKVEPAY